MRRQGRESQLGEGLVFAWRLDGGAFSAFGPAMSATFIGLAEAPHTFEVKARDLAGNEDATPAARSFTVAVSPAITEASPTSGPIGTYVTISGARFDPGPTQVTFNGLAAVVRTLSATTITTTVPIGATTGPLTVTTVHGSASVTFTVTLTGDFTLTAAPTPPATLRVIVGDRGFASIRAGGTGSFTSLVSLAVPSLPSGVTAAFSPQLVAPGAGSYLDLAVAGSVAPGLYAVTVNGTAQVDGREITRTTVLTLEVLAAGTPAVTGRILTAESIPQPIPGVTVVLGSAFVLTDAAGNFVLQAAPPGPNMLFVDGRTASTPGAQFPIVETQITVNATGPTRVSFIIYLPKLDTANVVTLSLDGTGAVTQDTIVTTPRIPGLEIRIPAGTRITGPDGNAVSQIIVTPVPLDRSPMPFSPNVTPTMLFAIHPGGAVPSQPLPITFPNNSRAGEGATSNLHYFDLTIGNWNVRGTGTVNAAASQIVSDPGFGLPRFAWHFPELPEDAVDEEGHRDDPFAGDPVNLALGRFTITRVDATVPGRLPIVLQRSYKSGTSREALFGIGWHLDPYDSRIRTSGASVTLVLSDRTSYRFVSAGPERWQNTTDSFLRGAVVTQVAPRTYQLRFKDGTVQRFEPLLGVSNASGLAAIVDRNGNTITVTRESIGTVRDRITRITGPAGRRLALAYDADGRIVSVTDPIDRVAAYTYDAQGRLATVTDFGGGVTRYAYDANHQILSIIDPHGIRAIVNEYDGAGRVIRQTQADGGVWRFDYTLVGGAVTQTVATDPHGNATTHRFSDRGSTLSRTDALGQTTTFEYEPGSNFLTSTTDALGRTTHFTYDTFGNTTSVTGPGGDVRSNSYESVFSSLTSSTDLLGHVTTYEYDARGNLIGIVDPLGHRTGRTHDAFGQPTTVTDPLGHSTTLTYDAFGNVAAITDALGKRTRRGYDAVSRLVAVTDPRGRKATFSYDPLDRLTEIRDARGQATRFEHDPNGNILAVDDARGNRTTQSYDVMDRLSARVNALGATETFLYDRNGHLTRHTDYKGQVTTFAYDPLGRRLAGAYADGAETSFVYDVAGRMAQARDSLSGTITTQFDLLDRRVAETTAQGAVQYEHDVAGRRTLVGLAGQPATTYSYDAASRLRTITHPLLATATIDYDAAGRRTRLTLPNGASTEYANDAVGRVVGLVYRNSSGLLGELTYQYDAGGHRLRAGGTFAGVDVSDAVASGSYDPDNRQATFGDGAMTFDANGNLTSVTDGTGVTSFEWDARNQLHRLSSPTTEVTFGYDVFGRRTAKTVNGVHSTYAYAYHDVVQETRGGAVAGYMRGVRADTTLARIAPAGTRFYLTDDLGSVIAVTGESGALVQQISYEPFGATSDNGLTESPFRFIGREQDETGLIHLRARYYSPRLHRFVSPDPLGIRGGLNRYVYAANRPLNLIDPWGLAPGDPYPTADAAGVAAVMDINPISIMDNREWGGYVYQKDGRFYYTWPVRGTEARIDVPVPAGTNLRGWYHTHGAYDPKFDSERFSEDDIDTLRENRIPGYLGTPSGRIKRYDPETGETTDLTPPRS